MRRVAILGGGESGIGAAILGKAKGLDVFLSDSGLIGEDKKEELKKYNVDFEEGRHTFEKLVNADVVVKSPGIPDHVEVVSHLIKAGKRVISEIEWAFLFCTSRIIAITGSNGKTTTTNLCHHLILNAGVRAAKVGNVGQSMARTIAQDDFDWLVVELSSFQLDGIDTFKPDIGMILNVTPDHLDRYEDFENYARSKWRMTENQDLDDVLIIAQSEILDALQKESPSRARLRLIDPSTCRANEVTLGKEVMTYDNPFLRGSHNAINTRCSVEVALLVGLDLEEISAGLNSFVNDPHRMEEVVRWAGITVINDSKATNVDAAEKALSSFDGNVIWIVGGKDKGNDYSELRKLAAAKVKSVIALGKDNSRILEAFGNAVADVESFDDLTKAVDAAMKRAEEGDVVLLSPACASFDLFENYIDRGNRYKKAILNWIEHSGQNLK